MCCCLGRTPLDRPKLLWVFAFTSHWLNSALNTLPFGMQGGCRVYILKLDYLSSDVASSLAVCDLSCKGVINNSTHHMAL